MQFISKPAYFEYAAECHAEACSAEASFKIPQHCRLQVGRLKEPLNVPGCKSFQGWDHCELCQTLSSSQRKHARLCRFYLYAVQIFTFFRYFHPQSDLCVAAAILNEEYDSQYLNETSAKLEMKVFSPPLAPSYPKEVGSVNIEVPSYYACVHVLLLCAKVECDLGAGMFCFIFWTDIVRDVMELLLDWNITVLNLPVCTYNRLQPLQFPFFSTLK